LRQAALRGISFPMTKVFNQTDRARLRERFFGATHSVRACL
jgi:hypothetical protein